MTRAVSAGEGDIVLEAFHYVFGNSPGNAAKPGKVMRLVLELHLPCNQKINFFLLQTPSFGRMRNY